MLKEAGIVVILSLLHLIGENKSHIELHLVFGLVLTVAALLLGRLVLYCSKCLIACKLLNVFCYSVLIKEFCLVEGACLIL